MDTGDVTRELAAFDAEVDAFETAYDAKAEGKAGVQKGMDALRSLFNRGADGKGQGDDQWKNIADTQHGLEQLKGDVRSGRSKLGNGGHSELARQSIGSLAAGASVKAGHERAGAIVMQSADLWHRPAALPPADIPTLAALPGTTERKPPEIDFPRAQDRGAVQTFPGAGVYIEADWRGEATAHVMGALLARAGRDYAGPIAMTARVPSTQTTKLIDYFSSTFPKAAVGLHLLSAEVADEINAAPSARDAHLAYRDWADGNVRHRLSPSSDGERMHDFVNATFVLAHDAGHDPQLRRRISHDMSAGIAPHERQRVVDYLAVMDAAYGLLDRDLGKALIHVRNDPRDAGSGRNMSAELMDQLATGARERGLMPVIVGDQIAGTVLPLGAADLTRFFEHLPGYAEQALMFKLIADNSRGATHIGMMSGAIDFAYLAGGAAASSIQLGPDNRLGAWRDAFGEASYGLVSLGPKGGSQLYPKDHYDASADDAAKRRLALPAWREFERLLDAQVEQHSLP